MDGPLGLVILVNNLIVNSMVQKLPSNYFKRLTAGENVCRIALPLPGKMYIYLQIFGHHMYTYLTTYVYVFGSPKLH